MLADEQRESRRWFHQWRKTGRNFNLLLWKNVKIHLRHRKSTCFELFIPLVLGIIMFSIAELAQSTDSVVNATHYPAHSVDRLPDHISKPVDNVNTLHIMSTMSQKPGKLKLIMSMLEKVVEKYLHKNFTTFQNEMIAKFSGKKMFQIAYYPVNNLTRKTMDIIKRNFEDAVQHSENHVLSPVLQISGFNSELAFYQWLEEIDFQFKSYKFGGIVFSQGASSRNKFDKNISITFRPLPLSNINSLGGVMKKWRTNAHYTFNGFSGPLNISEQLDYYETGFLYIQHALSEAIFQIQTGQRFRVKTFIQRMPFPAYRPNVLLKLLGSWLHRFLIISFTFPVIELVKNILYEKERQFNEYMKMMGLSSAVNSAAWFFKSAIFMLIISAINLACLTANRKILAHSSIWVLFTLMSAYSLTVTSFGFLCSTLFSEASTGSMKTGVLFFVSFLPYHMMIKSCQQLDSLMSVLIALLSNSALGMAVGIVVTQESNGVGCQWWNLFHRDNRNTAFSMGTIILMLVFDACLYLMIAIYTSAVFPGKRAIPRLWHFPLTWFWSRGGRVDSQELMTTECASAGELFEEEPSDLVAGVRIKNLSKTYSNGKRAVKNLSLNLYENQITAILGHNGAGKTTLISILTGLFPASSGSAYIQGHDISRDMDNVRKILGICPQYDILFDELTVEEHIRFFCTLKEFKGHMETEIASTLSFLNLEEQRNTVSSKLSGGMKRKLSVGIALCGGSKVVLLDEPTGAMDPSARRFTWNLLKKARVNRTLLLTTHSMEEAERLADRIMIMANGKMLCGGSSQFLKNKLESDYYLHIVKCEQCDVDLVTSFIQHHLAKAQLIRHVAAELVYKLPLSGAHTFQCLFTQLEARQQELAVASFGASETTMEEVFLRAIGKSPGSTLISETNFDTAAQTPFSGHLSCQNTVFDSSSTLNAFDLSKSETCLRPDVFNRGVSLKMEQLWAMLVKRCRFARVDWIMVLLQIVVPVGCALISAIFLLPSYKHNGTDILRLTLDELPGSVQTYWLADVSNSHLLPPETRTHRVLTATNSTATSLQQYLLKERAGNMADFNHHYLTAIDMQNQSDTATVLYNGEAFHSASIALHEYHSLVLRNISDNSIESFELINYPYKDRISKSFDRLAGNTIEPVILVMICSGVAIASASFVFFAVKERSVGFCHLQMVCGTSRLIFYLGHFVFDMSVVVVSSGLVAIVLTLLPLQVVGDTAYQTAFFVILTTYGFTTILIAYSLAPLFQLPSLAFIVLLSVYYLAGIGSVVIINFLYKLNCLTIDLLQLLQKILLVMPSFNMASAILNAYVNYIPIKYCQRIPELAEACGKIDFRELISVTNLCCPGAQYCSKSGCFILTHNIYSMWGSGIGLNLLVMIAQGMFVIILIRLTNTQWLTQFVQFFHKNLNTHFNLLVKLENAERQSEIRLDEDVEREKIKVHNIFSGRAPISENLLLIRNLTKFYSGATPTVDRLCLSLARGECFGLLGTNGAGKTTTFRMITGVEPASFGQILFRGQSVQNNKSFFYRNIGYCPQYDSLLDQLTCRDTLRIFARIRGVKESLIDHTITSLARELHFTEHLDKKVASCSGGNRRKLSTAVALVGDPPVVFLDEPTTGMDPVARRMLWDVISRIVSRGQSVILTSHSMEECEALCTRLAIMVNGQFRCLGSPQHLKNKFGSGYTLIIKIASVSQAELLRRYRRTLSTVLSGPTAAKSRPTSRRTLSEGFVRRQWLGPDLIATLSAHGGTARTVQFDQQSADGSTSGASSGHSSPTIAATANNSPASSRRCAPLNRAVQLRQFMAQSFPGATLVEEHQSLLTYRLSGGEITWSKLFAVMERVKVQFDIEYYSINQTTLEQVFLGFANAGEEQSSLQETV